MESSSIMQLSGWPSLFHLIAADFFITKLVSWGVARLWKPCPFEQTRCIQILLTISNFVPDLRPLNQFTTIRSSLATDWEEADIGGIVPPVVPHVRISHTTRTCARTDDRSARMDLHHGHTLRCWHGRPRTGTKSYTSLVRL